MPLISTWMIRVMVLVALVASVKIVITAYNHAIAGVATAQQNEAQAKQAAQDATVEATKARSAAAEAERLRGLSDKALIAERAKGGKFHEDKAAAVKADPAVVGKWDDTAVPDAVRKLRRARAAGDPVDPNGLQDGAHGAPGGDGGAPAPGRDERPAGGGDRGSGRVALVAPGLQP